MVALAVFAVGFVAIASVFPVAAALQRQVVITSLGQQAQRSAVAQTRAVGFSKDLLWDLVRLRDPASDLSSPSVVSPIQNTGGQRAMDRRIFAPQRMHLERLTQWPGKGLTAENPWPLADRGFPITIDDPLGRRFYTVSLVMPLKDRLPRPDMKAAEWRDTDGDGVAQDGHWRVYLFILHRRSDADYAQAGAGPTALARLPPETGPGSELRAWDNEDWTWANPYDPNGVPGVRRVRVEAVEDDQGRLRRFVFRDNVSAFNDQIGDDDVLDQVLPETLVLGEFGVIYQVQSADERGFEVLGRVMPDLASGRMPRWIWYAPPPVSPAGAGSPLIQIVEVPKAVNR
jgi:hypothetical protein